MTGIQKLFKEKASGILNVYCTAGYPELNDTMKVMRALQQNGADMIELGIPYSDPLADGPVIQMSSAKALTNGMSLPVLFQQLKDMRKEIHLPVILMGYLNPILQFGFEKFCSKCREVGIDGLIIPDLPVDVWERFYMSMTDRFKLDFIFLVTPETSPERIRQFDQLGTGFLYAVSSSGITGGQNKLSSDYLLRLRSMSLKNPVLVGFGIGDKSSYDEACTHSHGAIIGSAYIKCLADGDIETSTKRFLSSIRQKQKEI